MSGSRHVDLVATARDDHRATLGRQLLLRREPLGVEDAVRRVVALQAQEAASPYLALWNRLAGFDPAGLDVAFAGGEVGKATLMRITLHAVHAEDYRAFREAMEPSLRAPTGGPWSFGSQTSYVAPRARPVLTDADVSAASLRTLVLRYLEGFGPASVADVAQFGMVQRARARQALQDLAADLERLQGPNGEALFDIPGAPRPDGDTPAPPRLMAMWDSILLAYAVLSRVIPPDYRALVIRSNGDALPTLLVDGYVTGVWRAVEGGIEATAFHRLPDDVWESLAAEARSLLAFLANREPHVYRRYNHWWSKLPSGETRLLPAD